MSIGVVGLLLQYKYFVMVPLALVMQPVVGAVGGALARVDFFNVFIVYGIVATAALVGDIIWYWIGFHYGESFIQKFGRFIGITKGHVQIARNLFHRYHAPILFFSKITNGLGLAIVVLFTAGMSRVPFGRYLFFNVIGEMIWAAMIVSAGYFVSDLFISAENILGRVSIIVLVVLSLFILIRVIYAAHKRLELIAMNNSGDEV